MSSLLLLSRVPVRYGERVGSLQGAQLAKSCLSPGCLGEGEGNTLNLPKSSDRIAPENKSFSPPIQVPTLEDKTPTLLSVFEMSNK